MQVKIRFLGVLSVKYGAVPMIADIDPEYESLRHKIYEMIGDHGPASFVILKNGNPMKLQDPIENGDEFCVLTPISGG